MHAHQAFPHHVDTDPRSPESVAVLAIGMACSLGYDAATACAALRAGLVRAGPVVEGLLSGAVDGEPEDVIGHRADLLTLGFQDEARLARLLHGGLADLLRSAPGLPSGLRVGWYVGLPAAWRSMEGAALLDDASAAAELDEALAEVDRSDAAALERAKRTLEVALQGLAVGPPAGVAATASGHCAGIELIDRAVADLRERRIDAAIVAGADSWLDESTVQWLIDLGRLKSSANPSGLRPGEASSALLLARERDGVGPALASIGPIAIDLEPRALLTGRAPLGLAAAGVLDRVLRAARIGPDGPLWMLGDLNGETYRAADWGHAVVRLRPGRPMLDDATLTLPAESLGDVGAAHALVAVCIAVRAWSRGCAGAATAVVWAGSDDGARGCMAISGPPGGPGARP